MMNDIHTNDPIPSDPTKTISLDFWSSVPPKGSGESTVLPMFSGWGKRGKIVHLQLPGGVTDGQKSNEMVFVGSGGMRSFV